jgi:hypothetical protein
MPASPESQAVWAETVRPAMVAGWGAEKAGDSDQRILDALCWKEAQTLGREDFLTDPQERRAQAGDAWLRWAMNVTHEYEAALGL